MHRNLASLAGGLLALALLVTVLVTTEVLLPSLGFTFPRFGSAAMSFDFSVGKG